MSCGSFRNQKKVISKRRHHKEMVMFKFHVMQSEKSHFTHVSMLLVSASVFPVSKMLGGGFAYATFQFYSPSSFGLTL